MSTQIFVNLPVADLPRSKAFFESLGYHFNPQFTNEQGACLVISESIYAMLLTQPFFQGFVPNKTLSDAHTQAEVILALSAESRQAVDTLVDKALKAGASKLREPEDSDFMYGRSFQDLDGHLWEVVYMDMSKFPQTP